MFELNKQQRTKEFLLDILFDMVGGVFFGLSVNVFTAPNHIAPGGVTGFATLMNYLFDLPIGGVAICINVPLLLLAYRLLGKGFVLRTLKTVLIMNFFVDIGIPSVTQYVYSGENIVAGLLGGVLMGASIGVVLTRGSTTGGLDVVGRLLKLKIPHLSIGRMLFVGDFVVLLVSVVVYGNIESGIYGLICIYASSKMVDSLLYGMDKGKLIHVVSTKSEEIAKEIFSTIGRGATLLDGHGSYKNDERKVLMCAVRDNQYPRVKKAVYRVDPQAFVIVSEASDILGLGFRKIEEDTLQ